MGNSESLAVGDAIMLWDKKRSLGVPLIESLESLESVETGEDDRILRRCPNPKCLNVGIRARSTIQPLYKCCECGQQFDNPVARIDGDLLFPAAVAVHAVARCRVIGCKDVENSYAASSMPERRAFNTSWCADAVRCCTPSRLRPASRLLRASTASRSAASL